MGGSAFQSNPLFAILAGILMLAASGCSVQKQKNGQAEDVKLRTPVGSLDVRTNAVHGPDVGLPVYPGAVETVKHGSDSGSADIHMSFGNWHLNVKAIEYHSDDPEDKIVAFYKDAMSRYGDVLTCKNRVAVGVPSRTKQGLTCANDHEYEVNMKVGTPNKLATTQNAPINGDVKLLSGSPEDQRIVEFSPTSKGTKFSIVVVQLPHKHETD